MKESGAGAELTQLLQNMHNPNNTKPPDVEKKDPTPDGEDHRDK